MPSNPLLRTIQTAFDLEKTIVDIEVNITPNSYSSKDASLIVGRQGGKVGNFVWAIWLNGQNSLIDIPGTISISATLLNNEHFSTRVIPLNSFKLPINVKTSIRWVYTSRQSILYFNDEVIATKPSLGQLKENNLHPPLEKGESWKVPEDMITQYDPFHGVLQVRDNIVEPQ